MRTDNSLNHDDGVRFPSPEAIEAAIEGHKARIKQLRSMLRAAQKLADWVAERPILERSGIAGEDGER